MDPRQRLLGPVEHDSALAAMLIRRVVERADGFEQIHLAELDQPLEVFETDLERRGPVGRSEWSKLCAGDGLSLDGDAIDVRLSAGRRHSVSVRDAGRVYELQSVVVRPGDAGSFGNSANSRCGPGAVARSSSASGSISAGASWARPGSRRPGSVRRSSRSTSGASRPSATVSSIC